MTCRRKGVTRAQGSVRCGSGASGLGGWPSRDREDGRVVRCYGRVMSLGVWLFHGSVALLMSVL